MKSKISVLILRPVTALLMAVAMGSLIFPQAGLAAIITNNATGDIAGDASDLDITLAQVSLDVNTLQLVKKAFLTDGTALPDSADVSKGTFVQFLIYVDNPTTAEVDSVNIADTLPAGFTFQPGSIKVDSTIVSGATEAAIYAGANAGTAMSNANDGDMVGWDGSAVTAGLTGSNGVVTVPRNRIWAMVFTVRVD